MAFLIVNQNMLAGSNFTGVAPQDANGAAKPEDEPPVRTFKDLTDGGVFEFFAEEVNRFMQLERIILDLGNAISWNLFVRTTDGDGTTVDVTIADNTSAGGNQYESFDRVGKFMAGEQLILTTAGATSAMRAQITASNWS